MRLAQRVLLGAVLVISAFLVVAVLLSGQRLRRQLEDLTTAQLTTAARTVATLWRPGMDVDSLADALAVPLGQRITLIDSSGVVLGDSEFSGRALQALENHNSRSEVLAARQQGIGSSHRLSPSDGIRQLYVAIDAGGSRIARVAINTAQLDSIVWRARRDVIVSGIVALFVAMALAVVFSRQISKPVGELRDVATAIAAGDLSRRPPLSAPGEVGDLAVAVQRMAEQLDSRVRALESEDAFLVALVESVNEGVVAVDRQRRVVRINRWARQLLGVQQPIPFSVDLLPRDRALHDALAGALDGSAVERMEVQVGPRTLQVTARPLPMGGAVLAVLDLTATRRLEGMRRDFVANVSHELKTPLTAIRGFAETLASELSADAHAANFAATISANAQRMQSLIDDLLDLSRIESGGWVPTPATIDIAPAADEAAAPYREEALRRGATIAIEVGAGAPTVHADPVALRQALGNLIENAVRHTPAGGRITVFSRDIPEGTAIGVSDTGAGIPGEHLSRIFERFYRVDAARSRAAGGTGLGLAIVKHLAEAHGGRAFADSQVGRGTTVTMIFPSAA